MPRFTLPDGSVREFAGTTTGAELAASIGAGLAKAALAVVVNGVAQDLSEPLPDGASVRILTLKDAEGLEIARHTLTAQVLARAVKQLFPDAALAIGPTVDNGFYYDVKFQAPLSSDDLPKLEATMREMIAAGGTVQRALWAPEQLAQHFATTGDRFKPLLIAGAAEKGQLHNGKASAYTHEASGFVDFCRGPHAPSLANLQGMALTLTNLAGAYWQGDSQNEQLTRIYGVAFATQKEMDAYLHMRAEAEKRDHRKLGKELDIYHMEPEQVGNGLPLWLPNGMVLRQELEMLAVEEERKDGYQRVSTPVLAKEALYYQSGHLPYYAEDMYAAIQIDEERYRLRPMNCPHHHHCYAARPKSYRQLPYRIAEYGNVYRYEAHGGLSGLMRVRGMCMNDAHIYCREDQVVDEFIRVMQLHERVYKIFGIDNFRMRLSLPDLNKLEKYVNQPEAWLKTLGYVKEAMQKSGLPYYEAAGEAAFYGPKIDFQIKNAVGAEYTISTNQLDFLATQKFDLTYQGDDGANHPVYVIHRAPLGTHERFVAFLIEHYEGSFPTWLAPVQVMIIPITDAQNDYAEQVRAQLFHAPIHTATGGLRVEVDTASERMQKKILLAQQRKIPYMLVVGKQEAANGTVAVRLRDGTDLGAKPLEWVLARLGQEVATRQDVAASPAGGA